LVSDLYDDRLFMCPALRRREICVAISAALIALLGFAIFVHLSLLASMRPDVVSVFFRALALSGLLAIVPISLLWVLERRERQTPWLFAVAFLWGGCIATGFALPFNTAFLKFVDTWVVQHPWRRRFWDRMQRSCWRRRFPHRQGGGRARDLPVAAPRVPQCARRHRLWRARRRWI
jgi:hypothetical protein